MIIQRQSIIFFLFFSFSSEIEIQKEISTTSIDRRRGGSETWKKKQQRKSNQARFKITS